MTPDEIKAAPTRAERKRRVLAYYNRLRGMASRPKNLYRAISEETNLTYNQIAADCRDARKEADNTEGGAAPAPDVRETGEYEAVRVEVSEPSNADWTPVIEGPKRNRQPAKRVFMRSAVYDIETTDFGTEGYSGYVICCCILPLDTDEVQTLSIRFDEHSDDRRLVREIAAALNEYDILIGHNIASFDGNFLNSRLMFHGYPVLNTSMLFDTFQVAKALSIKTRKGLGNLMDYFGLPGIKTTIFRTSWNNVRSPYIDEFNEAMNDILYHCRHDVLGNRMLFDVLYPYSLAMKANPFKISKMLSMSWGMDNLENIA
jgi:DNA polymerase elongation subunit (family B)